MEHYCARCGESTAKKSDNLFVCQAGHENWINPAAAVSVFVVQDNKVLYGVRSHEPGKGKLDRPGGFIEVGETAEHAAVRETKEELGVEIQLLDFLGSYATSYQGRPNLNFAFIAKIVHGNLTPGDGMKEVVWLDIEHLPGPNEAAAVWFQDVQKDFVLWWRDQQG